MLNLDKLKNIVRAIAATRTDEVGCEQCFAELDRFVELHLAGKDADKALPLVKHHLEMCGDCKQEYEVLIEAIRATS